MYCAAFGNKFNAASSIAISNILAFSRGISMTFTLQDLKHLEIMAELEERPASPSEEPTVVEAVHAPTTLTEKLLTLAARLRTAGFVHQAESLENTFGVYKKAEQDVNLLYRAHSETGDDLLESAHPDGDVEMAPAQDHNGDVETLQSKHKKIIEVVQKTAQLAGAIKNIVIAQKFQALLDAVSKNYLNSNGNEVLQDKKIQNFVAYASNVYDMAQRVVQAFNNAGETQRITAFATLKTIINAPGFKIDSIDDVDAYIETILKTLQSSSPFKKASIVHMLRESLGVKTAQVPPRATSEHDMSGFNEFKSIVQEIIEVLGSAFDQVFGNSKYDVKFLSGLTTGDYKEKFRVLRYKLDNCVSLYNDFIVNNVVANKSAAISAPDNFLKACLEFAKDINDSIAGDVVKITPAGSIEKGFDSVTFAPQIQKMVTNLQHRWYKFWGIYGAGKKEDAEAHGKFLTHGQVKNMMDSAKVKLESLNNFINSFFLASPEVQAAPAVSTYLNGLVGFIKGVETNFDTIVAEALKFTKGVPSPLGGNTEMTTENIKTFITDKEFASKLDLSTNQTFNDSINSVITNIMTNLIKLVKENKAFEPVRESALNTLMKRIESVRAK
jgi:hypothetical protein